MKVTIDFNTVERKPQIISEHLLLIREYFSVEDKALVFLKRRLGRNIPLRKYAISPTGLFDLPFLESLCDEITVNFPNSTITISEKIKELHNLQRFAQNSAKLNLTPRDYQSEAVEAAINKGRGIIILPTSAGKTLVVSLISSSFLEYNSNKRVLILVPDIQLVQQTYKDFIEYGISESLISRWTGNHELQQTSIVVANSQIILSKKQDKNTLSCFDLLIVDECHKMASAEKISKLVKNSKVSHKFGLTGSLPEEKFSVWTLNRIFGPIIYLKKSIDLRNKKYISKVRAVGLELTYKETPVFTRSTINDPTAGYEEEINWIQISSFRNNIIKKLVTKLTTNTLILVDRIAHGEILLDFLAKNTDKKVYFVQGSVDVEEREQIKQLMEDSNDVVCIAISKIFSTGISIKNLHNIIFGFIGKARIKIIQSIGRSLRLHSSKQIATIFDVADCSLYYGFKHYEERKRLYVNENIPLIINKIIEN